MKKVGVAVALLIGTIVLFSACGEQSVEKPKLILVLSIDQMRFDYLTRFNDLYTGGFRTLLDQGAVFSNANFQHAMTWTGPGHSVILSGRHPRHSGIVANAWYDPFNIAEVGNGTLTNILGTRTVDANSGADIDGTYFPLFTVPGFTDQDQISNELRWSGSFSDNWDATIGLYYFDQDVEYRESRYIQIALLRALGGDMQAENWGVFWNNDFYVNDEWTLTAGIRYTDEEKTAQIITGACTDVVTYNCIFDNLSGDWSNVTPKLGAQWNLDDSSQLYGFWSKGFRSGGFNFRNAKPLIIPPGPTKEEENNTFEIGLKTDFADGNMRLNLAVFYNEIKDMQRELNIPDADVVVLQATINAGDVTIKGFEMDFVALLTDTFSINASYGWQDGEYTRIDPFVATIEPIFGTVIGPELPRLAPTNYNIGFSWDMPLGNSGLVNVAANHSFRERHPYNDSNTEFFSDQRRTNLSINWFSPGEAWGVSLYGKNLGDEANWGNLTSISGIYTAGPMQKGRFWGLEVNYRMQ